MTTLIRLRLELKSMVVSKLKHNSVVVEAAAVAVLMLDKEEVGADATSLLAVLATDVLCACVCVMKIWLSCRL